MNIVKRALFVSALSIMIIVTGGCSDGWNPFSDKDGDKKPQTDAELK